MPITSQSSRRERAQPSQLSGGGFSNSELRMQNTAESHECRPSDVTADFRHCQVGSRQFRLQYLSASKSSIKRAQIFFLYFPESPRHNYPLLMRFVLKSGNSLTPVLKKFTFSISYAAQFSAIPGICVSCCDRQYTFFCDTAS